MPGGGRSAVVKPPTQNRWRWAAALSWLVITTPLAYRLSAEELLPAAQYAAAHERIESLHWNARAPVTGHALAPETYLLAHAAERERHNDQRVLQLQFSAALMAAMTGGSLPFLLLVFRYRKRTGPTASL